MPWAADRFDCLAVRGGNHEFPAGRVSLWTTGVSTVHAVLRPAKLSGCVWTVVPDRRLCASGRELPTPNELRVLRPASRTSFRLRDADGIERETSLAAILAGGSDEFGEFRKSR